MANAASPARTEASHAASREGMVAGASASGASMSSPEQRATAASLAALACRGGVARQRSATRSASAAVTGLVKARLATCTKRRTSSTDAASACRMKPDALGCIATGSKPASRTRASTSIESARAALADAGT